MVLGHILVTLGSLGDTFSDFGRSWEQASNLMVFQGFPGRPQVESTTPVEGKVLIQGGSKYASYKHSGCKIQGLKL